VKLIELRGLPACGKTTLAREKVRTDGNVARVNRDDLRAMLFESKWTGKRERLVTYIEQAIARTCFEFGYNVIVDDTNLSPRTQNMWTGFVAGQDNRTHAVEHVIEEISIPLEECIARDEERWFNDQRRGYVGRVVIENMARRYGLLPELKDDKPIVLCDIDGTLADLRHRRHYLQGETKDWKGFFAAMTADLPIWPVIKWVNALAQDYYVFLVSGRPLDYQDETMAWLEAYEVKYHRLFMRNSGDKRPDVDVKAVMLQDLPKDRILFVIDDRPSVCIKVWRANGIPCYQVGTWQEWPASEYEEGL
jgi:predicted kinase